MKRLGWLAISILALGACKKEVKELAPLTGTGANTFGASVNGVLWAPKGFGILPTAPILQARYDLDWSVIINARNFATTPKESEFEIRLNKVVTPGNYPLNSQTGNYAYYVERTFTPTGEWKTSNEYKGVVNITTVDTVKQIVAGTFQFQAESINTSSNPKVITVTDGRFDVKVQ